MEKPLPFPHQDSRQLRAQARAAQSIDSSPVRIIFLGMSSPVPAAVSELPFAEKLKLVGVLWDELANSSEQIPLSDSLKAELDHRYQDCLTDPKEGSAWSDVKRRVLTGK